MKIRISDMLDNASELIEESIDTDYVIDTDRVKDIVFSKINHAQKNHRKKQCAAVLIIVIGFGSITVGAKELLRSAGIISSNRDEIMQSQVGHEVKEDAGYKFDYIFDFQTDLIMPENLYEENIPVAKYIVEVPIDIENKLPECYLDNGAMLIFTKNNGEGWNMEAGAMMQFEFLQEKVDGIGIAQPGVLEVGYILNGGLEGQQIAKENYNNINFCLEDLGMYYIYLKNCSSDRIIIMEGTISVQEE